MNAAPDLSHEYLQVIASLARAGRHLQESFKTDPSQIEFAAAALEEAAFEHGGRSARYQAFLFNQIESAPRPAKQRVAEDLLASVLADVGTANVLIAAGQALGETGQKGDTRGLEQALDQLADLQDEFESAQRPCTRPLRIYKPPRRSGDGSGNHRRASDGTRRGDLAEHRPRNPSRGAFGIQRARQTRHT